MAFRLEAFAEAGLDEARLRRLLEEHVEQRLPRLDRLWRYYRNPTRLRVGADGLVRGEAAQRDGLPSRLRGGGVALRDDRVADDRSVVIENDIGWRVQAMVDFMFGRPVTLLSTAEDDSKRRAIELILDRVFERSGGIGLLQDMALLGAVHGHVGLLVRVDDLFDGAAAALRGGGGDLDAALEAAGRIRIELVEAARLAPLVDPSDYRRLSALVIRTEVDGGGSEGGDDAREVVEIIGPAARQVYVDEALAASSANRLGEIPFAHAQNISEPFRFEGLSEVEPLIPLQDELNTRLSDRAHRVTMQSFRMYLAKGIEGFAEAGGAGIGPGRVWSTENPEASIESFGGDAASPSEAAHIEEVRQAMDKVSGVTPIAAGVIRARVGQLSSENALRITMMGLLAKTARKRTSFGRALGEVSRLTLKALDFAGVFETSERERVVSVRWPEPLSLREPEAVENAAAKAALGVDRERVLQEIGYAGREIGIG